MAKLKYKSSLELDEALEKAVNSLKIMGKKVIMRDYVDIILEYLDVRKINFNKKSKLQGDTYLIYNYDTKNYVNNDDYLTYIINRINELLEKDTDHNQIKKIDTMLFNSSKMIYFNEAPKYLVRFLNGVLNLKTKEFVDESNYEHNYFKYDYLTSIQYDYIPYQQCDKEMIEVVYKIFNAWSQNNRNILNLLLEFVIAVMDGDGRGSFVIMQSEGGDGKSSYQSSLAYIANEDNVLECNLHELDDDNVLNQLELSTKFMRGDDLASNFTLSGRIMSRLKSITSGEIIQLRRKFMTNKKVRTKALIIQNTNEMPKFLENNASGDRRLIYIVWPNLRFDKNPLHLSDEFTLKDLLNHSHPKHASYIQTLIAISVENTTYSDKFTRTKEIDINNQLVLSRSDNIQQFCEYLNENGMFNNKYLPTGAMYKSYQDWIKENNPSSKSLSTRGFSDKFIKELDNYGFKIDPSNKAKRIKSIKLKEFNPYPLFTESDLNEGRFQSEFYKMYSNNTPSKLLINTQFNINENLINAIKDAIINSKSLANYIDNIFEIKYAMLELYEEQDALNVMKITSLLNISNINELLILNDNELKEILFNE